MWVERVVRVLGVGEVAAGGEGAEVVGGGTAGGWGVGVRG